MFNFYYKIRIILIVIAIPIYYVQIFAQKPDYYKEYKKVSRPEKRWAVCHPFIARKAFRLTLIVRKASDSLKKTAILDGDEDGGQVDAFRHSYWMATLTQNFTSRKAYRLGKAHEKGDYIKYKKHKPEENSIPDKISSDMDLCNNLKGIEIGQSLKLKAKKLKANNIEIQKIIIDSILNGKMVVIKKNYKGEFLDKDGKIIPAESLQGKWINNKCLVPSNNVRISDF